MLWTEEQTRRQRSTHKEKIVTSAIADRSEGVSPSRSAAAEEDEVSSLAVHVFIF